MSPFAVHYISNVVAPLKCLHLRKRRRRRNGRRRKNWRMKERSTGGGKEERGGGRGGNRVMINRMCTERRQKGTSA